MKTVPFAVMLIGAFGLVKGVAPGYAHWVIAIAIVAVSFYLLSLDRRCGNK